MTVEKFNNQEVTDLLAVTTNVFWNNKGVRFGQALWNAAHDKRPELMGPHTGSESDFFHERDDDKAWLIFVNNFTI